MGLRPLRVWVPQHGEAEAARVAGFWIGRRECSFPCERAGDRVAERGRVHFSVVSEKLYVLISHPMSPSSLTPWDPFLCINSWLRMMAICVFFPPTLGRRFLVHPSPFNPMLSDPDEKMPHQTIIHLLRAQGGFFSQFGLARSTQVSSFQIFMVLL